MKTKTMVKAVRLNYFSSKASAQSFKKGLGTLV